MNRLNSLMRPAVLVAVGVALVIFGCKGEAGKTAVSTGKSIATGRPDPQRFNPTEASLCLQQMIKNPAGPFHLSFAENSSNSKSTSVEADVTPTTIDYMRRETSAGQTSTNSKRIERAQLSEMELDFDIMGPVPWHGELVSAQDSARLAGAENVNGYQALKYTIDTANEPAAQKATFDSLMAVKDYKIVGDAWVTNDAGCLVKYSIDFEKDAKKGHVEKTHFEGNVAKK